MVLLAGLTLCAPLAAEDKVEGYAEWRHGDVLIVDGQRVRLGPGQALRERALRAANFFFGSHSVAEARARNLARELKLNYPE